jgi:hypothetical protein
MIARPTRPPGVFRQRSLGETHGRGLDPSLTGELGHANPDRSIAEFVEYLDDGCLHRSHPVASVWGQLPAFLFHDHFEIHQAQPCNGWRFDKAGYRRFCRTVRRDMQPLTEWTNPCSRSACQKRDMATRCIPLLAALSYHIFPKRASRSSPVLSLMASVGSDGAVVAAADPALGLRFYVYPLLHCVAAEMHLN